MGHTDTERDPATDRRRPEAVRISVLSIEDSSLL